MSMNKDFYNRHQIEWIVANECRRCEHGLYEKQLGWITIKFKHHGAYVDTQYFMKSWDEDLSKLYYRDLGNAIKLIEEYNKL